MYYKFFVLVLFFKKNNQSNGQDCNQLVISMIVAQPLKKDETYKSWICPGAAQMCCSYESQQSFYNVFKK